MFNKLTGRCQRRNSRVLSSTLLRLWSQKASVVEHRARLRRNRRRFLSGPGWPWSSPARSNTGQRTSAGAPSANGSFRPRVVSWIIARTFPYDLVGTKLGRDGDWSLYLDSEPPPVCAPHLCPYLPRFCAFFYCQRRVWRLLQARLQGKLQT
ncbi:hypothetical protein BDY19DRAFT_667635 [Irpex rosettiformis]|uniref:Uncharacterized protein n=1 Tax=Irpex rosettiformis TaxID=378272 RepID=A0ACB8U987_9APHY|nr:hypothetical protein BDY19DRAFT_667635 [Irpex rosettiformis]